MVAEVQYGGRITDDLDRELFTTYAAKWLNESMTLGEPSHWEWDKYLVVNYPRIV